MIVFADRHHAALSYSLHLLAKRLGFEIYFPIGMSWFPDFWKIADPYGGNIETAKQYLQIKPEYHPMDGTVPLNHNAENKGTHYEVEDVAFGYTQKCITLEQFKTMRIDVVLASYNAHIPIYHQLISLYHPSAKFICQVGNSWIVDFSLVKNLLSSTLPFEVPSNVNAVFYHQEFDTSLYAYEKPMNTRFITSFVNCLGSQHMFDRDWNDFQELERLLPEHIFSSYGASCRDGVIHEQEDIAESMKQAKWGFHAKTGGDGYGHVLHQWAACGRPVIYRGSQYRNKLGGLLLTDMVTGIDLDKHSLQETAGMIQGMSESQHTGMCEAMRNRFKTCVDFDREEKDIKTFFEKLL